VSFPAVRAGGRRQTATQVSTATGVAGAAATGTNAATAAAAVVVVAVVVVSLFCAGPAYASASGSDNPGGTVTVGASDGGSSPGAPGTSNPPGSAGSAGTTRPGGGPGRGSSGASPWTCTYTSLLLNDVGGFAPGGPTPGGWYSVTCFDRVNGASTTQTEWIATQTASTPSASSTPTATPTIDPRVVALQAESSLLLPTPSPHSNPVGASIVNLPTWLWIDASIWHPFAVTATAGTVSATAVATPVSVTWQMGDGGREVCAGPGQPFDLTHPAQQQVTACRYTYRASSLGQPSPDGDPDHAAYPVRATITWSVSWTAQGAPGAGVLPSLTTTGQASIRVVQVESINSGLFGLSAPPGPLAGSSPADPSTTAKGAPS
jgi:hypothetical protein